MQRAPGTAGGRGAFRILHREESPHGVHRAHVATAAPVTRAPMYWVSWYVTDGVLVDSGIGRARDHLARSLDAHGVKAALATHEHEDHVGNARLLQERGIPLFAPESAVARLKDIAAGRTRRLPRYRQLAWGNHDGATEARAAAGRVTVDGRTFTLIETPGHSADHACILDEENGHLFTGDAVLGKLKMLRRVEDAPLWIESLRAIAETDPRVVFPAHGPVLEHPRARLLEIVDYMEDLQRRAHRLAARGWSTRRITRDLLGREEFMAYFSAFAFSKRNLVASLLSREPDAPPPLDGPALAPTKGCHDAGPAVTRGDTGAVKPPDDRPL